MTTNVSELEMKLNCLENEQMIAAMITIAEEIGEEKIMRSVRKALSDTISMNRDDILADVFDARNLDIDDFLDLNGRGYVHMKDTERCARMHLYNNLVLIQSDIFLLETFGKTDDAKEYLGTVIEGLRTPQDGLLECFAPGFANEFADHLEECAEKGDLSGGFEFF
ncbi:MAG: hypothetical protein WCQ23_00155 [Candidatus Methanomethylophilaceae archaeon]|jgi:hypothetical protein